VPLTIYHTDPPACDPQDVTHTGNLGNWFYCTKDVPSPSVNYVYGIGCGTPPNTSITDDSGILQVEVKVTTPPNAPTCSAYTLAVNVKQAPE
jgi:hypothetical protein